MRTVKLSDSQYELVVSLVETRAIELDSILGVAFRDVNKELKEVDDLLKTLDGAKES